MFGLGLSLFNVLVYPIIQISLDKAEKEPRYYKYQWGLSFLNCKYQNDMLHLYLTVLRSKKMESNPECFSTYVSKTIYMVKFMKLKKLNCNLTRFQDLMYNIIRDIIALLLIKQMDFRLKKTASNQIKNNKICKWIM